MSQLTEMISDGLAGVEEMLPCDFVYDGQTYRGSTDYKQSNELQMVDAGFVRQRTWTLRVRNQNAPGDDFRSQDTLSIKDVEFRIHLSDPSASHWTLTLMEVT